MQADKLTKIQGTGGPESVFHVVAESHEWVAGIRIFKDHPPTHGVPATALCLRLRIEGQEAIKEGGDGYSLVKKCNQWFPRVAGGWTGSSPKHVSLAGVTIVPHHPYDIPDILSALEAHCAAAKWYKILCETLGVPQLMLSLPDFVEHYHEQVAASLGGVLAPVKKEPAEFKVLDFLAYSKVKHGALKATQTEEEKQHDAVGLTGAGKEKKPIKPKPVKPKRPSRPQTRSSP